MPTRALTIARNTFIESLRQPVVLVLILVNGILMLLTTWSTAFSMTYRNQSSEVTGDDKLLLDVGMASVFLCGVLLAAFVATSAISREIENKTVLTVVSKPIGRPSVVLGKFFGIAATMFVGMIPMLMFLLAAIRHGVMSTAADTVDQPVVVFMLSAVGLSIVLGAVANYLYSWSFSQVAVVAMVPLSIVAYIIILSLDDEWGWQSPATDFKPQVTMALVAIMFAMLVISALATAASTRLGQVMTIVVCAAVFVLGLMSNHLFGRHAFQNRPIGQIALAEPEQIGYEDFARVGDLYNVTLLSPPAHEIQIGTPFFYGASPNGLGLIVPAFELPGTTPEEVRAELELDDTLRSSDPGAVVTAVDDLTLTVRVIGRSDPGFYRAPRVGDFVFEQPTRVEAVPLVAWSVVPNMHFFWLLDAITQNNPVPMTHLVLIAIYGTLQVLALLSIAVLLFEGRDVG